MQRSFSCRRNVDWVHTTKQAQGMKPPQVSFPGREPPGFYNIKDVGLNRYAVLG
jgi:hypothetical protein